MGNTHCWRNQHLKHLEELSVATWCSRSTRVARSLMNAGAGGAAGEEMYNGIKCRLGDDNICSRDKKLFLSPHSLTHSVIPTERLSEGRNAIHLFFRSFPSLSLSLPLYLHSHSPTNKNSFASTSLLPPSLPLPIFLTELARTFELPS